VLGMAAAGYSLYELAVLGLPDRGRIKLKRSRGANSSDNPG
jgi:hypothetical protein